MRRPLIVVFVLALAGDASVAAAQELAASVVHLRSDHELLESSTGFGVSVGARVTSRFGLRLGMQRTASTFSTVGVTCSGLIGPDEDCSPEPRTDRAQTRTAALSAVLTLAHRGRWRIDLVPGLQWTRVRSEQVGVRTGRARDASKANPGVDLGLEVSFEPVQGRPFAVLVSGGHALLDPLRTEHIADGYTPFEERIGLTRIALGLIYRR